MFEKDNFDDAGYLIKKNFFNIKLIAKIFKDLDDKNAEVKKNLLDLVSSNLIEKNSIAIENGNIKYLKNPQIYFKSINFLVQLSLIDLCEKLIGENIYVDAVELHQKYPEATETPPHQDNFYMCLKKGKALTAYIPLNDQSFENGALAVLPGSHKNDLEHHSSDIPGFSSGVVLNNNQINQINYYTLKAGDLSIHHCNIVHLAPPNKSKIPRINVAIRLRSLTDSIDDIRLEKYKKFRNASVRIA